MSAENLPILQGDFGTFSVATEGRHNARRFGAAWAVYTLTITDQSWRNDDPLEIVATALETFLDAVIGEEHRDDLFRFAVSAETLQIPITTRFLRGFEHGALVLLDRIELVMQSHDELVVGQPWTVHVTRAITRANTTERVANRLQAPDAFDE